MDPASGVITHAKLRMWLRSDGIVQVVLAPRAAIVLEDAIAAVEAVTRLTGGRLSPCWWTCTMPAGKTGPRSGSSHGGVTWCRPSP